MSDPPNNQQEENNTVDQGNQELHARIHDLQEENNQMRESNIRLFRATAREMDIIGKEVSNLTSIVLTLKENFDSILPIFIEQKDKIRELETRIMNMENHQLPKHRRDEQEDIQDVHDEELVQDQDENDENEKSPTKEEQDNEQKQANSKKEEQDNAPSTPKSIIDEMHELTEHEDELIKPEPVLENESAAVNDPPANYSAMNDIIQEEAERVELANKRSDKKDHTVQDLAEQKTLAEKELADKELADKESTETDSNEIDSSKQNEMESIVVIKELAEEVLVGEGESTNKQAADQETTSIESAEQALSKTDSDKVDEEKDTLDIVMTELGITKGLSEDDMELTNNESTRAGLSEDDSKNGSSMEIDSTQYDTAMSNSVQEEEEKSLDKEPSKADMTEDDVNKENAKEVETAQELIALIVAAEEKELPQTEESQGESQVVDKGLSDNESANDGPADPESNMEEEEELIEHDIIKQESMDPESTPKDHIVQEPTSDHAEVEKSTEISTQKDVQETTAIKEPTAVSSNEKDIAEQDSTTTTTTTTTNNNMNPITDVPPQTSVPNQETTPSPSNSKPKRKYKNPIVLIKKRRKISSNKSL